MFVLVEPGAAAFSDEALDEAVKEGRMSRDQADAYRDARARGDDAGAELLAALIQSRLNRRSADSRSQVARAMAAIRGLQAPFPARHGSNACVPLPGQQVRQKPAGV